MVSSLVTLNLKPSQFGTCPSSSVNLAYEAATADLDDVSMIDPFHLQTYGETTVNYNRDIEIFPVLKRMLERILGESPYASPTDMGVNMVGFAITDNEAAIEAKTRNHPSLLSDCTWF